MHQVLKLWISFTIAITMIAAHSMASAFNNFVTIRLPKGVSIELPKNWVVLSGNQRITLDSAVKSGLDLSGIEYGSSEFPFAANYYDDKGANLGIVNIRYYPQIALTQVDAEAASSQDVKELDATFKEDMLKSTKPFGITVTSWIGTHKTSINGIIVFITDYRTNSIKGTGEFRARLVHVFSGDKSFTLTVSYHEKASFLLKPITDKIINSLDM